jgi:ribonucleoside-diphosphate reductase alpha chain
MTIIKEKIDDRDSQRGDKNLSGVLTALNAAGITDPVMVQKITDLLDVSMSNTELEGNSNLEAEISDNAMIVLKKRYFMKDNQGNALEHSWSDIARRVARAIAETELLYNSDADVSYWEEKYYNVMVNLEYVPNSPTLMNAGSGAGTLSACFVMGLEDSMEGIMETAKEAALVQKFGGGTGFALSKIRPKGSPIATTHGKACGPIAVLRHLSSVSTLVTQGGKRDGANMAVMDVHHPDILEFITCKTQEGEIHNFNISVGASEVFMQAVRNGKDYELKDPHNDEVLGTLNAGEVFGNMIEGAWLNGEPGAIFLDRVNQDNPTPHIGEMIATNPCGEQPLLAYESCNLGSINLAKFVLFDRDTPRVNWDRLAEVTCLTTRFLDNVIDANKYSVPAIEEMTKTTRKTGLGVMGFADMLVMMNMAYDSKDGLNLGQDIMRFIKEYADSTSEDLAEERGVFPGYEGSVYEKQGRLMRNACRLTVAPTGTISMIAGCSSGIEPLFSLCYHKHNILEGESLLYIDSNFERIAKNQGFYSDELMEYLADGGSIQDRDDVPISVKDIFVTAGDISPEYHVRMQAVFQESVDAAISKTINFPNSATREDVRTAYILAWELGCKGITVYRSGSRNLEVLTSGSAKTNVEDYVSVNADDAQRIVNDNQLNKAAPRPSQVSGITEKVRTGHGNMYITINSREGQPFEIFSNLGKAGGCDSAQHEAISRLVSLALRSGIESSELIEQLRGITCCPQWDDGKLVRSGPDAVALVLEKHASRNHAEKSVAAYALQPGLQLRTESNGNGVIGKSACPDCDGFLVYQEGCDMCPSCGYSRCG